MAACVRDIQPDGRTVEEMLSNPSLEQLSQLVVGLGPGKQVLAEWRGQAEGEGGRYYSSGVVEKIHRAGLMVSVPGVMGVAQGWGRAGGGTVTSHVTVPTTSPSMYAGLAAVFPFCNAMTCHNHHDLP